MRPESPFQDPNRTPTGYNKGITPQELDGLIAVLKLTQTVASWVLFVHFVYFLSSYLLNSPNDSTVMIIYMYT